MKFDKKEMTEIYNGLCCLNCCIRDKQGQKRRTKYIQNLIQKIEVKKW